MKKRIGLYLAAWAVLLAVFNVIAFVTPSLFSENKFTSSFWIGYSLITVMMIGQLICSLFALRASSAKKMFYNISLLHTSYVGLVASFVVGGICIILTPLAYWIGAVACAIVLAVNVVAVIKATVAIDAVEKLDNKIAAQTFFIKAITADAEALMAEAKTDETVSECKKVYEALRYSDPMSHEALAPVENELAVRFAAFANAVKANDADAVSNAANEVIISINNRNKKCKLFK